MNRDPQWRQPVEVAVRLAVSRCGPTYAQPLTAPPPTPRWELLMQSTVPQARTRRGQTGHSWAEGDGQRGGLVLAIDRDRSSRQAGTDDWRVRRRGSG